MEVKIFNLSLRQGTPCSGYWDYGMVDDIIGTGEDVRTLKKTDRAIVKIAARHHSTYAQKLNKELKKIDNVVLFLMGDEEADFPVQDIEHPSIHIWVQNPHKDKHDDYDRIGTGYTPHSVKLDYPDKDLNMFFSGQITHHRREEMYKHAMQYSLDNPACVIKKQKGFTQGLEPSEYIAQLSRARICPCPSGAVIPDSFRVYECLQTMVVPIADEVNPSGTVTDYWDWLFNEETPFPKLKEWSQLREKANADYDIHQITAWWIRWKRDFKNKVMAQYGQ